MNKWDKFFIEIANTCANQSTCLRRKVGAVLVLNNRIISTGYNGAPSRTTHCKSKGCLREKLDIPSGERHEICVGAHAEANAIVTAAKHGIAIDGATLYCTTFPCSQCAKLIINSGIKEVFYLEGYPDDLTKVLFNEASIIYKQLKSNEGTEIICCPKCRAIEVRDIGQSGHECKKCKTFWCNEYIAIIDIAPARCSNCRKCTECFK